MFSFSFFSVTHIIFYACLLLRLSYIAWYPLRSTMLGATLLPIWLTLRSIHLSGSTYGYKLVLTLGLDPDFDPRIFATHRFVRPIDFSCDLDFADRLLAAHTARSPNPVSSQYGKLRSIAISTLLFFWEGTPEIIVW